VGTVDDGGLGMAVSLGRRRLVWGGGGLGATASLGPAGWGRRRRLERRRHRQ
jgi:hypothetical protein